MRHKTIDMRYSTTIIGRIIIATLLSLTTPQIGIAQTIALRHNLLYDATLTPNLGLEVRTDSTWSLGVNAGLNAWDINKEKNKKWRHLLVSPFVRHYFGHKADTLCIYSGKESPQDQTEWRDTTKLRRLQYVEANAIYSHYNAGNIHFPFGLWPDARDHRFQGDLLALGAKYGYGWILSRNWRIEAEAGVAVGYAWFKEYDCPVCGAFLGDNSRIFLLPQLGINVVYIIN